MQAARRVKTPTILQMEAVECGAAALAMILAYYGKILPLEEVRIACGVSRDGSKASNVVKAARTYGLNAYGARREPERLRDIPLPAIIHWNFNHFVVLEGFQKDKAYINDPASGSRSVSLEEFDQAYTGVVLIFETTAEFVKSGQKPSLIQALRARLSNSRQALAYILLVGLFLVVPGLVLPTFTRIFIDDILLAQRKDWLMPVLIGLGTTAIFQAALTWLREWYLTRWETKLAITSSAQFFWHILRLPLDFFSQRFGGEIGSRVQINDKVARLLSGQLASAFLDCLVVVFFLILLFQYDVVLTLAGVAVVLLNIAYLHYLAKWRIEQNQKLLQDRGKVAGVSMGGLQIIESIKAGGNENDFFVKWSGQQAKLTNAEMKLSMSSQMLSVMPAFLSAMNTTVILAIGSLRVMEGQMTIGMLMAFQSLMANFIQPFDRLLNLGAALQETEGDLNRLDDVLRYREDSLLSKPAAEMTDTPVKLEGYLELSEVSFGYSRLEPPLIENFSLALKPGQRVALVGGSGSGKSTVTKVVSGLYQPWSGEVLLDGRPRQSYRREFIANSLAVVDQDVCLFEGSVRDNLTLWDVTIPESDMVQAAKDAAIHDDIAALFGGYEASIDEGGRNFSGGQRQRLEIARALAGNPAILILDEATSALDPLTEQQVEQAVRRRGCTCLVVAHRLSTIRDCDEIIVLEQGKVVQRGTHVELKDVDGPYKQLIQADDAGEE